MSAQDARGITPLGVAVGFNRLAVVKLLLTANAKVDVCDGRGNTPLHYAAGTPVAPCKVASITYSHEYCLHTQKFQAVFP